MGVQCFRTAPSLDSAYSFLVYPLATDENGWQVCACLEGRSSCRAREKSPRSERQKLSPRSNRSFLNMNEN